MIMDVNQERVCSLAKEEWAEEGTAEEKWIAIRLALTEAARSVLGKETRHQPHWYKRKCSDIRTFVQAKKPTLCQMAEHQ